MQEPPERKPDTPAPQDALPAPCGSPSAPALDDLVAYADGALASAEAARVAAHLETCAPCRRELALLRRSDELLARLPAPVRASAGFADRVLRAVHAESALSGETGPGPAHAPAGPEAPATSSHQHSQGTAAPAGRLLSFARVRLAVAAAVVLAAVGGVWLAGRGAGGGDGTLSSAEEEAIARDLLVLANLEALQGSEADELARLADDLDAIEAAEIAAAEQGG